MLVVVWMSSRGVRLSAVFGVLAVLAILSAAACVLLVPPLF